MPQFVIKNPMRDTMSTGGRVDFVLNTPVRIITTDGRISGEVYEVTVTKSDRRGHVSLRERGSQREIRVQHRRIIPVDATGAVVIESSGKFRAVCPKCNYVETILSTTTQLTCPLHNTFPLYGTKPMSTEAAVETTEKPAKPAKPPKPAKEPKVPTERKKRTATMVDLDAIASTPSVEVWSRATSFDHAATSVKAHVVLFTGAPAVEGVPLSGRKYCFNTYNGSVGNNPQPPIAEFVANTPIEGAKKPTPWFEVKNLEKARESLKKSGYELHVVK